MKTTIKLRVGFQQSKFIQDFQVLAIIVKKTFGGEDKQSQAPQNMGEAQMQFAALLGGMK